jgi:hypothetical protein
MAGFQDVVVDCDFVDLGFSGLPYTWDNRQEGAQNVEAPLDRAFGDHRFLDAMGDLAVKVLPIAFSDHAVVLVEVREKARLGGERRDLLDTSTCGRDTCLTQSATS